MAKAKPVKKKAVEKDEEEGMSLDDAFGDDDDVEYAPAKPKKTPKKKKDDELDDEIEEEVEELEKLENGVEQGEYAIKASKSISKVKKGDRVWVDDVEFTVDAHIVLIEHGSTNEMALEIFDPASDKDYQLRYFSDQVERTMEFYELKDILYVKRVFKKVEW
jgi:hypothetical protein